MFGMLGLRGAMIAVAVVVVSGGALWVRHEVRVADEATAALAQDRIAMVEQRAEHDRIVAALQLEAARQGKVARQRASLLEAIRRAPKTAVCASQPALVAALDGLRKRAADEARAAADPGQPDGVRAGADPGGNAGGR